MNKILLTSILVVATSTAFADLETKTCASFARGAAESLYLTEATGIQGHTYDSSVVSYKENKKSKNAEVTIEVTGSNDENDSWTSKYSVITTTPSCSIVEINDLK